MFVTDNLRLRRADPNALPAVTERLRPPELHVHLHQLRRVVRRALEKLPEKHHLPRRQRGGVLGGEEQAQRSTRRLQGMGFHETSDISFLANSQPNCFRWHRLTRRQSSNSERRGSPSCRWWTFCPRTTGCLTRPSASKSGRCASIRVKVLIQSCLSPTAYTICVAH